MLTCADQIDLANLKREFEYYSILCEQFPNREDFKKRADSAELLIISIEQDNKYV